MSFILRWLGLTIEKPDAFAVRPSRTFETPGPREHVFDACLRFLTDVAGANIAHVDRAACTVEATFGLIDSERVGIAVEDAGQNARVHVESRRLAGAGLARGSAVMDRLESFLRDSRAV